MLNELGKKIIEINTANGWNVLKPQDWSEKLNLDDFQFDTPHHVSGESMGNSENYWRVFASSKIEPIKTFCGTGRTSEQAMENVRNNISIDSSNYRIPAILALIHTEVSEATEAFRADDKANFAEECADILIRVLDLTTGLGIDIETVINAKLEKNKQRGFKHGGKRI